ncbi:MAG TPA: PAS domain S-box protein [Azospira sp.]|nr:PAS domain S-box protein [Azospira sp.]
MHPATSPTPLQVLLVEDSPDDADLVLLELAEAYPAITSQRVESAAAMEQALASQAWDLVISDYHLPRFSADAALRLLQDRDIPCIVVSGFVGEESAAAIIKAGADDFVMKGNLSRLPPVVERALRDAATRRENRKAQEELRRNEKRLRAITAAMGEAVFVVDAAGLLRWMNPEAEHLLGWGEAELIGKSIHEAIHRTSPDGPALPLEQCCSHQALQDGKPHRNDDDLFLCKDGTVVPVSYVGTPLIEDGKIVGAVAAIQDMTAQKLARQELQEARQRSQTLSAHLQSVREDERTHIARELHDQLGQMLTALKIDVTWLQERVSKAETACQDKIAGMRRLIDDTLQWVRRMSAELRPIMLDDLGLTAALEWLLEEFSRRHGVPARLEASGQDDGLSKECSTAAFRIVQECLTNIARHARAQQVSVNLDIAGERLTILVEDDGVGFDPEARRQYKHFGLIGIRERAEMLGGKCQLVSAPDAGTSVRVDLPLTPPPNPLLEIQP